MLVSRKSINKASDLQMVLVSTLYCKNFTYISLKLIQYITLKFFPIYHMQFFNFSNPPITFKAVGQAKAALQSTKPRCDSSTQKLRQLIQMEATVDQAAPSTPRAGIFRASMPNTKTASKILSKNPALAWCKNCNKWG